MRDPKDYENFSMNQPKGPELRLEVLDRKQAKQSQITI